MTLRDELRIRELLELVRIENNCAERETHHGDGWLYDHAGVIHGYTAEIDELLAKQGDPDKPAFLRKVMD